VLQIREIEEQCHINEQFQKQISEVQLENKRLLNVVDVLKKQVDQEQERLLNEDRRFKKRVDEAAGESENLAKENISLRMYVSRLETEVEISRKAIDEISVSRQRDARMIESQKAKLEDLTNRCQELEDTNTSLSNKLAHAVREKSKTLAAMEVTLDEKNRSFAMLENSLKIAIEEVTTSEKGFAHDSQEHHTQISQKNEEINKLLAKLRDVERERQNEL
jgi:chromosome segregation ATPase